MDTAIALFEDTAAALNTSPLADRMRPRALDDVIGQDHIVGKGRLLRRAIQADRLSSVIFYGPPGTGKTSLARVIANTTKSAFESLNAVLAGIKDIRDAIDRSSERRKLYARRTILFVDEVHRWNKAQQDALLPWVENGTVILVGATTENPFFEVNRALVSRSRVFQLKALEPDDLRAAAERALADRERGYGLWNVSFEEGALTHLVEVSGGDARSLLNALELAVETSVETWPPPEGASVFVSFQTAEESIQKRAVLYDRDGDYHFDTISAFIKSVRGSDPDAALYWLAKMVRAGEDPAFIFRRMIILASEDVGLADPYALSVVISCAESFERIGYPEGNFPLAHACLYLAAAPKSNSAMAFFDALAAVDKEDAAVPNHLKDPGRDGDAFGHGQGYVYPHAYREHWRAQQYLPDALQGRTFYVPGELGFEKSLRSEVLRRRELQAAALMEESGGAAAREDFLAWSPHARGREHWYKRLEGGLSGALSQSRAALFEAAAVRKTDRVLVACAGDGLLVWEAQRRAESGLCAAAVSSEAARDALLRFAQSASFEDAELPQIAVLPRGSFLPASGEDAERLFGAPAFERILAREILRFLPASGEDAARILKETGRRAANLLCAGGLCVFLVSPPKLGERVSRVLLSGEDTAGGADAQALILSLQEAEEAFFGQPELFCADEALLRAALLEAGLDVTERVLPQKDRRLITPRDIDRWFDETSSSWGAFMKKRLGGEDFERLRRLFARRAENGAVEWRWKSVLFTAAAR